MWTYYVDAMIELNRDGGRQAQFRRSLLGRAFKAATETGHMSEDHYQKYIELLFSDLDANKAELIKVFEQAVAKYETSLRLWSMYLTYYLHRNDYENVRAVFRRAKKILGRKSIPLWRKYLTYLRVQPANEQVAEFNRCMNEIVALQHAEYNELKAHIVTMHYKIGTIARARRIYKAFVDGMPNCYEVHAAMADLEAKCVSFPLLFCTVQSVSFNFRFPIARARAHRYHAKKITSAESWTPWCSHSANRAPTFGCATCASSATRATH